MENISKPEHIKKMPNTMSPTFIYPKHMKQRYEVLKTVLSIAKERQKTCEHLNIGIYVSEHYKKIMDTFDGIRNSQTRMFMINSGQEVFYDS